MEERRQYLSANCASHRQDASTEKRYEAEDKRLSQRLTKESFLVDHKRRLLYCWNHKASYIDHAPCLFTFIISSRLPPAFGCGSSQSWGQGKVQKWSTINQAKYDKWWLCDVWLRFVSSCVVLTRENPGVQDQGSNGAAQRRRAVEGGQGIHKHPAGQVDTSSIERIFPQMPV